MLTDRRLRLANGLVLAVRSHVPDRAHGPAFLLVHGLASNLRLWDGVAPLLADRDATVHAVDLRGHGQSDKPDSGYQVDDLVDDLSALASTLDDGPYIWVGQSWGGNLVVELAAHRPDLATAVCTVDGGFIDLQEQFPSWEQCARVLAPPQLVGTARTSLETMLRARHADWPETGIQGVLHCFEVREDGTVAPWLTFDRHLQALRGLWQHHPQPALAALTVPTLLLVAEPAPGPSLAKQHAVDALTTLLPGLKVRRVLGDHDLHAQQPALVAEALWSCGQAHG